MITLVAISGLGILCLLLEVLNLRKILVPITLLGLLGILVVTIYEYCSGTTLMVDPNNMVVSSTFSQTFSSLFILLAFLIIAMSPKFYEDKKEKIADYVSLKVFLLAGAIAMVSFGNLSMFFIGVEVLSISAYVLAASNPLNLKSNEAGMKYFIMGAFASSFILFGIALIYGAIGSFDINVIKIVLENQNGSLPIWINLGFVMVLVGLLFKASVVPFHFWAPDVYEGSPTLVTAMMSTLVKVAAIATLFKVIGVMSALLTPSIQTAIIVLSILSLIVGNITALKQTSLKRMMAYSGISHAGFMIMDILSNNLANSSILYYASAYSLAALAAFAVIMAVTQGKDNEDISNLYGLAKRNPALAAIMTCAMLSLGGIPVFAGFFAKLFVFNEMFQAGHIVLVLFGVINSVVAIYYYFSTASVMFTKDSIDDSSVKLSKRYTLVAALAITLNILLGIFPSIIMDLKL